MGLKRRAQTQTAVATVVTQVLEARTVEAVSTLQKFISPPQEPSIPVQDETPVETFEKRTEALERPANYGYIGRTNCLAWEAALKEDGEPVLDSWNRPLFKLRRVPPQKGQMYCPDCHGYFKFKPAPDGEKQCPSCGLTTNDHYIKTANGLWPQNRK